MIIDCRNTVAGQIEQLKELFKSNGINRSVLLANTLQSLDFIYISDNKKWCWLSAPCSQNNFDISLTKYLENEKEKTEIN